MLNRIQNRSIPGLSLAAAAAGLVALLGACAPYPVVEVDSTNQSSRVDYIVIHFTSENFAESMRLLTEPTPNPVSSHYLIPQRGDATYPRFRLILHRLVPEYRRAWHAGRSYWAGEESLNDRSIGIEIVNLSACDPDATDPEQVQRLSESCTFTGFDDDQIEMLVNLLHDILERYPGIDPVDIVGHSDIAPARKFDPGPLFPWKRLYDAGIGAWYEEDTVARYRRRFRDQALTQRQVARALDAWGYRLCAPGVEELALAQALRAFQMHFRAKSITATADVETVSILYALLERYRPDALAGLAAEPELPATSTLCAKPVVSE